MIDYNRQMNLDYTNTGLWETLKFSADDLWPGNPLAGFGRADVNSALTWMANDWHLGYQVEYLNPDENTTGTPEYWLGSNVEYYLRIINNSNKDFSNLEVTSYHINLEGEHYGEKISDFEDHLDTNAEVKAGTFWETYPAFIDDTNRYGTEPGLKGTDLVVKIGEAPIFLFSENSFIIEPIPPGVVLHQTGMPSYLTTTYYSGAAVAEMILDYVRKDVNASDNDVEQSQLYKVGGGDNTNDFNAFAMDQVLGKYDPYDYTITSPYNNWDSRPDGNPYQGYNYTVDSYDTVGEYMTEIVHWMSWPVTQTAWFLLAGDYVAEPRTPAALPILADTDYGTNDYTHWVAVNGYAVSDDPTPDPYDPWTVQSFTVYGFWLTDPIETGIGQHVYVTAAEAQTTYFKKISSGDAYNGKYVQVAEPPAMPPEEPKAMMAMTVASVEEEPEVKIAEPVADPENLAIIQEAIEAAEEETA